ncbi:MAG: diguanylate cyclase [Alphaproteobacteria bacterium]|nr:diguanylate cyclase [Alphaproteobacteria bacterium]MDP6814544.1 diguanylate cyclase [Alphaproteobacteria bacterium]
MALRGASAVEGHAGPAILFDRAGTILSANGAATPIVAALRDGAARELLEMVTAACDAAEPAMRRFKLPAGDRPAVFDISLLPVAAGRRQQPQVLLLARDSTFDVNFGRALVASRQMFKDLVACSADFAWETDSQGQFSFVSSRGLLGYTPTELEGRAAGEMLAEIEGRPRLNPFQSRIRLDEVECWMRHRDGQAACMRTSSLPVFGDDGTWLGVRGVCHDITEDRLHEAALNRARERERLTHSIVDSIRNVLTPEEMFAAAATTTAEATDASHVWIMRRDGGDALTIAASHGKPDSRPLAIEEATARGFDGDPEVPRRMRLNGSHLLLAQCHYHYQPKGLLVAAWDDDAASDEAARMLRDVADQLGIAIAQAEIQERLEQLSIVDELTGLLNRRGFHDSVQKRLAQHRRTGRFGALLYVDMDNFKAVNDTHGHAQGDAALKELSGLLAGTEGREGDIAGRLGGDEFVVWLEETDVDGAIHKAEELLQRTGSLRRFSGDPARPLTVSAGIVMADPNAEDELDELLRRADGALYRAKRDGKGRAVLADYPPDRTKTRAAGC